MHDKSRRLIRLSAGQNRLECSRIPRLHDSGRTEFNTVAPGDPERMIICAWKGWPASQPSKNTPIVQCTKGRFPISQCMTPGPRPHPPFGLRAHRSRLRRYELKSGSWGRSTDFHAILPARNKPGIGREHQD